MGAKWSTVSTATYADGSPSDDGSATEANRIKFTTIRTDLTDPLDTAIDAIVANLDELFDESTTPTATNYTTVASDHTHILEVTSAKTITLLAASTAGASYRVGVYASGADVTVARSGADTINGATSLIVSAGKLRWFTVNGAGDGYITDDISGLPRGYISGLLVTNDGGDPDNWIGVSVGECRNDDDDNDIILGTALIKQLDAAFAAGTNQGALGDTVSISTDITLHIFAMTNDTSAAVDILADTSTTGANAPAGWTVEKRIGSVLTDTAANLVAIDVLELAGGGVQNLLDVPVQDYIATTTGTAAVLINTSIPDGFQFEWMGSHTVSDATPSGATHVTITSPDTTDAAPSASAFHLRRSAGTESQSTVLSARTDTSSQVRFRCDQSAVDITHITVTNGWIDRRVS